VGTRNDAGHLLRLAGVSLLAPSAMTRQPTFAARVARLFTRPLVRITFLMRSLATLAGNLFLLAAIHGRKSAIFFCHVDPLVLVRHCRALQCNGGATLRPSKNAKKQVISAEIETWDRAHLECALSRSRRTPCNYLLLRQQGCAVESSARTFLAQQFQHFIQARADAATGDGDARRVDEQCGLEAEVIRNRPQH